MKVSFIALALVGLLACDGGTSSDSSDVNYPCVADALSADGTAGAGEAPDTAGAPVCTLGKTYCYIYLPRYFVGAPTPSCKAYDESDSSCARNPTCDCLCSGFYACNTECRCTETNGFPTVSCEQI
jgi:hypothetical protein